MFASQLVTDFHAAQSVRAISHERAILKTAEQHPERLALLLKVNPKMLNHMADPEAVAKTLADTGYVELCDQIAHSLDVTRDVRQAFKARGAVDHL